MSRVIELNLHPDERTLRQFGFIACLGFGTLAACAWFEVLMFRGGLGATRAPLALACMLVGVVAALCSLIRPRANRLLFVGLSIAGYPLGLLLSYVILALIFFVVFAPAGLSLRLL